MFCIISYRRFYLIFSHLFIIGSVTSTQSFCIFQKLISFLMDFSDSYEGSTREAKVWLWSWLSFLSLSYIFQLHACPLTLPSSSLAKCMTAYTLFVRVIAWPPKPFIRTYSHPTSLLIFLCCWLSNAHIIGRHLLCYVYMYPIWKRIRKHMCLSYDMCLEVNTGVHMRTCIHALME